MFINTQQLRDTFHFHHLRPEHLQPTSKAASRTVACRGGGGYTHPHPTQFSAHLHDLVLNALLNPKRLSKLTLTSDVVLWLPLIVCELDWEDPQTISSVFGRQCRPPLTTSSLQEKGIAAHSIPI